jgi:hypothetical protein
VLRLGALSLLLAVAFSALGCASDSDDSERWVGEANGLCRDLERALASLDAPRESEEPDELAPFVAATASEVDAWLVCMRELEPREAEKDRVERMLDRYSRAVRTTEQAARALEMGDESTYRKLLKTADRSSAQGDAIARDLGAGTCTYPLSG